MVGRRERRAGTEWSRMKRKTKYVATGAVAAALVAVGAGVSAAAGGFDSETPITGDALVKASAAALAATGGGRVTETEAGRSTWPSTTTSRSSAPRPTVVIGGAKTTPTTS